MDTQVKMDTRSTTVPPKKYPLALRVLHWVRAILIGAQLWTGWTMMRLDDSVPEKYHWYYPHHKEFGLLTLLVVLTQLTIRWMKPLPPMPPTLPTLDRKLAKTAHYLLYTLAIVVPLMGYSLSSTYTQSAGIHFFSLHVPELLPKNDHWFAVFDWLHKVLAYTLLVVIAVHIVGALKHRFFDKNRENDVLRQIL